MGNDYPTGTLPVKGRGAAVLRESLNRRDCYGDHQSIDDLHAVGSQFMSDVAAEAARAMLVDAAFRIQMDLGSLEGACQSPIESLMLCALVTACRDVTATRRVKIDGQHETISYRFGRGDTYRLDAQARIGPYTADFVLTCHDRVRMVIECDGHAYHERTKEQAAHDRERDRFMQTEGYLVYRFTGSQIWADAFGCALEATEAAMGRYRAEAR